MGGGDSDGSPASQTDDDREHIVTAVHDVAHLAVPYADPASSDASSGASADACKQDCEEESAAELALAEERQQARRQGFPAREDAFERGPECCFTLKLLVGSAWSASRLALLE
jgi:hypothetical protein